MDAEDDTESEEDVESTPIAPGPGTPGSRNRSPHGRSRSPYNSSPTNIPMENEKNVRKVAGQYSNRL